MRTQQILLHESGLASYLDVLGGSPVIETLTDRYRDEARRLAAEVEEQGGAAAAIANGFMRAQIDEDSWRSFQASGQKVGATEHETKDVELFGLAEDAEAVRIKVIEQFKAARSPAAVEAALARVAEAVASGANVVEPFKTAFLNGVTLGEICTVLTERFGRISMIAA
jgi:methylmalonyl-CoA mutase, N-terminal domain